MKDGGELTKRRLKEISSLSLRKYREAHSQTLVEGFRSIQAAVAGGVDLIEILITEKAGGIEAAQALVGSETPIYVVRSRDFDRVSDVRSSQGLLAVARFQWAALNALRECRRIIALDSVQDPGNVGTIIRGAAWMGVEAILCGPGTADAFSPKAVRASMGGVWDVVLARTDDLASSLADLKGGGHTIAVADLGGSNVTVWSPAPRTVLVFGNEGSGISADVGVLADEVVTVFSSPNVTATESLNVAMAAAIMMHNWGLK